MKKILAFLSICPFVALTSLYATTFLIKESPNKNNISYIIKENDVVKQFEKNNSFNDFNIYNSGNGQNIVEKTKYAVKKLYKSIFDEQDLDFSYYYGTNQEERIVTENESNDFSLFFTLVIRSDNNRFYGSKKITFDYRPKISEFAGVYFNNTFGRSIEEVIKALKDWNDTIAFKTDLINSFNNKGYKLPDDAVDKFKLSNTNWDVIKFASDYDREQDYNEEKAILNIKSKWFDSLDIKTKSSYINFDSDAKAKFGPITKINSNFLKNDLHLSETKIESIEEVNSDSTIGQISELASRSIKIKLLENKYINQEEYDDLKINVVIKKDFSVNTEPYDEYENISVIEPKTGLDENGFQFYLPSIEIWGINNYKFRIQNEKFKDGPATRMKVGVVNKNEN